MKVLKTIINKYTIFVSLILLSAYPYVINLLLGMPGEMIMNLVFFGLLVILCMSINQREIIYPPKIVVVTIIVQCVCWSFFGLYHDDSSYVTRIFFLLFTYLILYLLCSKKSIYKFGLFYNYIVLIQALLGAIAFILVFLNLLDPLLVVGRGSKYISFYGLTCSNTVVGNFIRVSGFFDEPGALASWGIFILVINKLIFNNRIVEFGLLVFLLFTFSAAFFIILPIYIFLYYRSNLKSLLLTALILFPVAYIGYSELNKNEYFQWITTDRFSGMDVRSKRTDYAEHSKNIFMNNVLMGIGGRNLDSTFEETSDNQYEILAKDGIVGYVVTYLPLLLLCIKLYKHKKVLYGCLLLFICYQQRPFHINEMHYFMLFFYMTIVCYRYDGSFREKHILDKLSNKNKMEMTHQVAKTT